MADNGIHDGRRAVVTGAAAGLGAAYAKTLAAEGAEVLLADVDDASAVAGEILAAGGRASVVLCDVSSEPDVARLSAAAHEAGGCDILVNNAGISPSIPWEQLSFQDWRRTMSVNLDSMFLTCRQLAPPMVERGWGRIINVTSDTWGMVIPGFVHYIASKGGVIGFTRGLATEMGGGGVTVNAVAPGLTRTATTEAMWAGTDVFEQVAGQQAIKRAGEPDDLAGVVSFLASEPARFVTGQTLFVDGGLVRSG